MPTTLSIVQNPVKIQTTETLVAQPAASHDWTIGVIRFCNVDTSDHPITIFKYSGAGPGSDDNTEYKQYVIQAHSTFEYGPAWLGPQVKISALSDANDKIIASVHGLDITGP